MESLPEMLPTLYKTLNQDESNVARYIINYVFGGYLNPKKNDKFPGSMVVSMSREQLGLLDGRRPEHVSYTLQELSKYIDTHVDIVVPTTYFLPTIATAHSSVVSRVEEVSTVDFGSTTGLHVYGSTTVNPSLLDFGSTMSLYRYDL